MATKYGLIGKNFYKGEIIGYFVIDSSNNRKYLPKETTYKLAEKGLIINWEVVTDSNGEKHLYSQDYQLSDIPNMTKESSLDLEVVAKLMKDGEIVGYSCVTSDGIKHNYNIDKFWQLVKLGSIKDVKAGKFDNRRVIQSNKMLSKLPELELS